VTLGVAVGMTRETVLEALEVGYRRRLKSVRDRRREAARRRGLRVRWRHGIEWRLRTMGVPVWVRDEGTLGLWGALDRVERWVRRWLGWGTTLGSNLEEDMRHHHGMRLNLEALTRSQLEAAAMEAGAPLVELLPPDFKVLAHRHRKQARSTSRSTRRNTSVGRSEAVGGRERSTADRGMPPPAPIPLTHARLGMMTAMLGRFALAMHFNSDPGHGDLRLPGASAIAPPAHDDNESILHVESSPTAVNESGPSPFGMGLERAQSTLSLTDGLESFKSNVEREERRAFYARFVVAWSLFLVFWTVRLALSLSECRRC
jgi:potassium channel subfamily K, other eukaryote